MLSLCLLLAWGYVVYSNTLEVPFYFDDVLNIVETPALHLKELSISGLVKILHEAHLVTRPVANLSFALNYYFNGVNVSWYHLVNIAIHLFCGVLMFLLFRHTLALSGESDNCGDDRIVPFFAALIWLVHPVNTQTVTYIVQRMNGLAAMFFLLALYCYICARRSESTRARAGCFLAAFFSWVLALGSKEIAVVLPLVILLYEWLFFQNSEADWFKRNIPYIAFLFLLMIVPVFYYSGLNPMDKVLAGYEHRDFSLLERMLTQGRVVGHYASLLFYPAASRLSLEYDFPVSTSATEPLSTILALLVITLVIGLSLTRVKEKRIFSFGILWFFITISLESSVVPLEIIFEHRTYLPYVFLIFAVVNSAFSRINRKSVFIGFMSVIVLLFSFWTFERNNLWRTPVPFWEHTVAGSPDNARANNYLGMALADEYRYDEAIPSYRKAIRLQPLYYHAHNNLVAALIGKGLYGEASKHLLIAAKDEAVKDKAYNNLGMVYASSRDLLSALKYFSLALKINPSNPDINNNLGGIYAELGQLEKAMYHLEQALESDPDNANSYSNLGHISVMMGQPERAAVHYREALKRNPEHVNAEKGLASLYRKFPGLKAE